MEVMKEHVSAPHKMEKVDVMHIRSVFHLLLQLMNTAQCKVISDTTRNEKYEEKQNGRLLMN